MISPPVKGFVFVINQVINYYKMAELCLSLLSPKENRKDYSCKRAVGFLKTMVLLSPLRYFRMQFELGLMHVANI